MVVIQLLQKIKRNEQILHQIRTHLGRQKQKFFIGDYQIVGNLGKGAFGSVFKAIHSKTSRPAAVKVIDIDALMERYPLQETRQKLRRYLQTQELLMKKCHSAFVVKLYQAHQNDKCKVLIMEYCRNGGLDNLITQRGALDEEDAIEILRQIILGLSELHRNNIIHRDLKPANILINNGIFKIADFGFSKELPNGNIEQEATMLGSKNTMAPEVKSGEVYGLKADIWSLGMIYFMMVFPDTDLNCRFLDALSIVQNKGSFKFKTVSGKPLSQQSTNFLKNTLCIETSQRMNWEQTLEHPLFLTRFERMASVYLPGISDAFQNLKSNKQIDIEKCQNTQRQLIDFQKLKEESKKMLAESIRMTEQQLNWQLRIDQLNQQYLECRIAEFIFHEIVKPIQTKGLLNKEKRSHVEFLFLLLNRCRENIISAKDVVQSKYPKEVADQFCNQVKQLQELIKASYNQITQNLTDIENKYASIIQDSINKLFDAKTFKQKEMFLTLFERKDFTKEEQIIFTCEKYLLNIVNEIKGKRSDQVRMKNLIKSYREINEIRLEDLGQKRIQQIIDSILEKNQ